MNDGIREEVRARYAAAARAVGGRGCGTEAAGCGCGPGAAGQGCGPGCGDGAFGSQLYEVRERSEVPADALRASLGCGNPTAIAELRQRLFLAPCAVLAIVIVRFGLVEYL